MNVNILVASNSSIHLEAALDGLPTFYYEMSKVLFPDYYGYVKMEFQKIKKNFFL